jgi:hypothetical protein
MRLLHYTCSHAAAKIGVDRVLRPNPLSFRHLLWLTDLEEPDAFGLGLTSFMLNCDRTEFKCVVETENAVRWTKWAHDNKVDFANRLGLDGAVGAKPLRWWVSEVEVPILSIERLQDAH